MSMGVDFLPNKICEKEQNMNEFEKLFTQGFAAQSPESADKFQAGMMESAAIHAAEKARDEIMEQVARTLAANRIHFKLTKQYKLDMTNVPIPNEKSALVDKAAEIVKKYGAEEAIFEN